MPICQLNKGNLKYHRFQSVEVLNHSMKQCAQLQKLCLLHILSRILKSSVLRMINDGIQAFAVSFNNCQLNYNIVVPDVHVTFYYWCILSHKIILNA